MEQAQEALKKLNVFAEMLDVPLSRPLNRHRVPAGMNPRYTSVDYELMTVCASRGQVAQGGREYR
jgi:hypothetical protein